MLTHKNYDHVFVRKWLVIKVTSFVTRCRLSDVYNDVSFTADHNQAMMSTGC